MGAMGHFAVRSKELDNDRFGSFASHRHARDARAMSASHPITTDLVRHNEPALCADCVAKVFCPSERVRLIQNQASMRNVDSRIHSLRFNCCIFLFYSLSAMTFATQSAHRVGSLRHTSSGAIGGTADTLRADFR